jgi:hypothetical protein
MAGPTSVVPIGGGDVDGDGVDDLVERSVSGERALRGAQLDSETAEELVEMGVLSEQGYDVLVRKKAGEG